MCSKNECKINVVLFDVQVILSSIRQSDEDGEIAAPDVEEVALGNHQFYVRYTIAIVL